MTPLSTTDHTQVILGCDVGGTSTRVAVATTRGRVLAIESERGGNPAAVGVDTSAARLRTAITQALAAAETTLGRPLQPVTAAVGLAGITTLAGNDAETYRNAVFGDLPSLLVADLVIAYASGTWQPHGIVTIAGTGSGAVEVQAGSILARRDAWGWLVGDDGSAWWMGREAVRETMRQYDRQQSPSALARAVTTALGATTGTELIAACYRRDPHDLAALAPHVSQSAAEDPAAQQILDRAAELVAERVLDLGGARRDLPVVLAGSLASHPGPLHRLLVQKLRDAGVAEISSAGDGLVGALWLASQNCPPNEIRPSHSGDTSGPAQRWSQLLGSLERCRTASSDNFDH